MLQWFGGAFLLCSGSLIWQQLRVFPGDRSYSTSNKPWDLVPPSKDRSTETSVSELADRALIDRCVARQSAVGGEAAWEEIVRRYRRKVFGIAYKFTGRYEESEDLTQEIFFRVFRSLDRFDRGADFGTWLYSVSRNHCIDHYRSGRREREALVDREISMEDMPSGRFDPHRSLEASDHKQLLSRALAELPAKLREAVVLRDIHGLTYQEIVDRLGLPEGTVKSRINRGRLELGRVLLASNGNDLSKGAATEKGRQTYL